LAIIDKRREGPNQTQIMNIIGDVAGKSALLLDDMIDTAGTIVKGRRPVWIMGSGSMDGLYTRRAHWAGIGPDPAILPEASDRDQFDSVTGQRAELPEVASIIVAAC